MTDERAKRPAYQWHVLDARGDEVYMLMTYEQRGIYRELLDQQWIEGSLPASPEHLAGILRLAPTRFAKLWPLISSKFRARDDGRLINDRLEAYRSELEAWCKKQAENGRLGGRPKTHGLATANPRQTQRVTQTEPKKTTVSVSVVQTAKEQQSGAAGKPPSPAREFLTWFQDEYRSRRNGAAYFVSWGRHMPIVTRLLNLHSPERLRRHAAILLDERTMDPWIANTDRGIEILASKINWLEERLCEWEKRKQAREAI